MQTALAGVPLRWVPPRNMHLTLKFLGETQPRQVATLADALQAIASQHSPLDVRLAELGIFPNSKQPRVLWVGLHAPAALAEIAQQVEHAAVALGFATEPKPFTPHLTLARTGREAAAAQLADVEAALAAQPVPEVSASLSELGLFESQLKAGGAVYNPLVRSTLRTGKG